MLRDTGSGVGYDCVAIGACLRRAAGQVRDGVEHEVDAKPGLKVMETLRELDYGVAAICGGMCSCATCHVYVDPECLAALPAPSVATVSER